MRERILSEIKEGEPLGRVSTLLDQWVSLPRAVNATVMKLLLSSALIITATSALAGPLDRDPSELGVVLNAHFSARDMATRVAVPRCKEGAHLKSCSYKIGSIEVVSQGKPSSNKTSKITASLFGSDHDTVALFMIAAVSLVQIHSPVLGSAEASSMIASLTRAAVDEGKGSKIVDGVYYSAMRSGSQIDFFVMPE